MSNLDLDEITKAKFARTRAANIAMSWVEVVRLPDGSIKIDEESLARAVPIKNVARPAVNRVDKPKPNGPSESHGESQKAEPGS